MSTPQDCEDTDADTGAGRLSSGMLDTQPTPHTQLLLLCSSLHPRTWRQAALPSTMQAKSFPATSRMKTRVKVLPLSSESGLFCFTRHAKEPQGHQVTWSALPQEGPQQYVVLKMNVRRSLLPGHTAGHAPL